jgi:hypothetical protein
VCENSSPLKHAVKGGDVGTPAPWLQQKKRGASTQHHTYYKICLEECGGKSISGHRNSYFSQSIFLPFQSKASVTNPTCHTSPISPFQHLLLSP